MKAALQGRLETAPYAPDPVFGVSVPMTCPGVPERVLRPREAWPDKAAYDRAAADLAAKFKSEYKKYG